MPASLQFRWPWLLPLKRTTQCPLDRSKQCLWAVFKRSMNPEWDKHKRMEGRGRELWILSRIWGAPPATGNQPETLSDRLSWPSTLTRKCLCLFFTPSVLCVVPSILQCQLWGTETFRGWIWIVPWHRVPCRSLEQMVPEPGPSLSGAHPHRYHQLLRPETVIQWFQWMGWGDGRGRSSAQKHQELDRVCYWEEKLERA